MWINLLKIVVGALQIEPPCIMCVQYRGHHIIIHVGDTMITIGDFSTLRGFSIVEGITFGNLSTMEDIMTHVGDTLSTVEGVKVP